MDYTLPKGKDSRSYKLVNEKGENVVDGSLKDLKELFAITKDNLVVKGFIKRVGRWATANKHTFTINGSTVEETYPIKDK